jgi:ABC-type sugar transport system substrate-binding protein
MNPNNATRREALLAAGGLTAAVLAGCGAGNGPSNGPHTQEVLRTSLAVDYASYYAPVHDLTRLIQDAAQRRHLAVTFSDDAAGATAQAASLKLLTGRRGGFEVVAIAPFAPATLQGIVSDAHARGIKIAGFVTPLPGADIHVGPAPREAARTLIERTPRGPVLLVLPPARSPVPDPFFGYAASAAETLHGLLGSRAAATTTALGTEDATGAIRAALSDNPNISTILTWNDATALGALAAAPHADFVGALGAPAPATKQVLQQLEGHNAFKVLVATRLQTLAGALVDLTAPLLRGTTPSDEPVPVTVFTPGGAATRAALADYA